MLNYSFSFWSSLKKPASISRMVCGIVWSVSTLYTSTVSSQPLLFFAETLDPKADAWVFLDEEEYTGSQTAMELKGRIAPENGQLVDSLDDQKVKVCQQCDSKWF